MALVSAVVGVLNWAFVHDPSWGSSSSGNGSGEGAAGGRGGGFDRAVLAGVWREILGIMRTPTFAIIIIQASGWGW